jgi:hypothetical protein
MNPFRMLQQMFVKHMDPALIVGTWKDKDGDAVETYTADNRVISKIDQRLTVPVNQSGFVGTSSAHVTATAHGKWSLRGNKLTIEFTSVENLLLGDISLDCENGKFDEEFTNAVANDAREQLSRDLPDMLTGSPTVSRIVSASGKMLITRGSSGEIDEQIRVEDSEVRG